MPTDDSLVIPFMVKKISFGLAETTTKETIRDKFLRVSFFILFQHQLFGLTMYTDCMFIEVREQIDKTHNRQ